MDTNTRKRPHVKPKSVMLLEGLLAEQILKIDGVEYTIQNGCFGTLSIDHSVLMPVEMSIDNFIKLADKVSDDTYFIKTSERVLQRIDAKK